MRTSALYSVVAATTLILTSAPLAQGQHTASPATMSTSAPVTLAPGARVRLATVTGRIVCEATVEHADSATLTVETWRRDRQTFAWQEVQYLWRGVARQKPAGWNALQVAGAIVGVVGTGVVLQRGKQSEGFAPLGWILGMLPLVLGSSLGLVMVGTALNDGRLTEFTEWQRLPLAPMPSDSGLLPQHVPAVCGD